MAGIAYLPHLQDCNGLYEGKVEYDLNSVQVQYIRKGTCKIIPVFTCVVLVVTRVQRQSFLVFTSVLLWDSIAFRLEAVF